MIDLLVIIILIYYIIILVWKTRQVWKSAKLRIKIRKRILRRARFQRNFHSVSQGKEMIRDITSRARVKLFFLTQTILVLICILSLTIKNKYGSVKAADSETSSATSFAHLIEPYKTNGVIEQNAVSWEQIVMDALGLSTEENIQVGDDFYALQENYINKMSTSLLYPKYNVYDVLTFAETWGSYFGLPDVADDSVAELSKVLYENDAAVRDSGGGILASDELYRRELAIRLAIINKQKDECKADNIYQAARASYDIFLTGKDSMSSKEAQFYLTLSLMLYSTAFKEEADGYLPYIMGEVTFTLARLDDHIHDDEAKSFVSNHAKELLFQADALFFISFHRYQESGSYGTRTYLLRYLGEVPMELGMCYGIENTAEEAKDFLGAYLEIIDEGTHEHKRCEEMMLYFD